MTTRTKHEILSFDAPFRLPGIEGLLPAGNYEVETEEELLEQMSFPAYHRLSTTIRVPLSAVSYQVYRVEPDDLAAGRRAETNDLPTR